MQDLAYFIIPIMFEFTRCAIDILFINGLHLVDIIFIKCNLTRWSVLCFSLCLVFEVVALSQRPVFSMLFVFFM